MDRARLGAYADYDALVEAFVKREIDLALDASLAYVKIKRRLEDSCQVVAMRDVDVNFTTHFITMLARVYYRPGSQRQAGRPGDQVDAGGIPYYFLQQLGLNPGA